MFSGTVYCKSLYVFISWSYKNTRLLAKRLNEQKPDDLLQMLKKKLELLTNSKIDDILS